MSNFYNEIMNAVRTYAESYRAAVALRDKAVAKAEQEHGKQSRDYADAVNSERNRLVSTLGELRNEQKSKAAAAFSAAKADIAKIVSRPADGAVLGILPLVKAGELDENEIDVLISANPGYMNQKLLSAAAGRHFEGIERLYDDLSFIEAQTAEFFRNFSGGTAEAGNISYESAVMLHGAPVARVANEIAEFSQEYQAEAGNNG